MKIETKGSELNLLLTRQNMCIHACNSGVVTLTIPEKPVKDRNYAIRTALSVLKMDNLHLKITAIGFTPCKDGFYECIINFEEKH